MVDAWSSWAAERLVVGFSGTSVPPELDEAIARGVGGVILFGRNVEDAAQVAALTAELKARAGKRPLLVAVDQEGGRVARLKRGFSAIPPMRLVGRTERPELARSLGAVIGAELRAVGVDLDFAPVVDVDTNPENPVIGDRSFGPVAARVASFGAAFIEGMQGASVAACAKHFPGHGDTLQDSHSALPRLPHDFERLDAVELVPFQAAVGSGVASVMSAHVVLEALDRDRPATLSEPVLGGVLRRRLGFDGVVFSDDFEMSAIADHYAFEDAAVRALVAGVDEILVCHRLDVAHGLVDALSAAARSGAVPAKRVEGARRR
jgi:beta-N-acetylhexosaminidase